MTHPAGAITTEEELKLIIILGLSVECWDVDMNTIKTRFPTRLIKGQWGLIIQFRAEAEQYAKWFGLDDPTYKAIEVLTSIPDKEIHHAYAALYMFNQREEALAAQTAHRQAVLDRRKTRV